MAAFHFPPSSGRCPVCNLAIGSHRLTTGGRLLAVGPLDRDGSAVVLAEFVGPQPFVTWQADAQGNAFFGHYFAGLPEAAADFELRVKRGH